MMPYNKITSRKNLLYCIFAMWLVLIIFVAYNSVGKPTQMEQLPEFIIVISFILIMVSAFFIRTIKYNRDEVKFYIFIFPIKRIKTAYIVECSFHPIYQATACALLIITKDSNKFVWPVRLFKQNDLNIFIEFLEEHINKKQKSNKITHDSIFLSSKNSKSKIYFFIVLFLLLLIVKLIMIILKT